MRGEAERVFLVSGTGLGLLVIAFSAFSFKSRKQILERDGYKSALSGEGGKLEAAHIDHSRNNPRYDDPSNGRSLRISEHYLDHYNRHGRNGLSPSQNKWALKMIWERLSRKERRGLPKPESLNE